MVSALFKMNIEIARSMKFRMTKSPSILESIISPKHPQDVLPSDTTNPAKVNNRRKDEDTKAVTERSRRPRNSMKASPISRQQKRIMRILLTERSIEVTCEKNSDACVGERSFKTPLRRNTPPRSRRASIRAIFIGVGLYIVKRRTVIDRGAGRGSVRI